MLRKPKEWSDPKHHQTLLTCMLRCEPQSTVHTAQPSWNWIRWHWSARQTNSYRLHHFRSVSVSAWFRPGRRQNDIFLDKSITGARRRSLASPRPISGHGVCSYPGIDSGGVSLDLALLYTLCRINRPHSISSAKLCILCNRMKNGTVQSWTSHRRHKQATLFMDNGDGKVS